MEKIGDVGEDIASEFLKMKGYKIIERNFRRPFGEIDVVAIEGSTFVFVEVKTRDFYNVADFNPELSVNFKKQDKLRKICEYYLSENRISVETDWRIDVIGISIDKNTGKYNINHIKNAVWDVS